MPFDATQLNAAVAALTAQVQATEGVEASAIALITGFSAQIAKAVADAIAADDAADKGTADAVAAAIKTVTDRFTKSGGDLGAAVTAGSPTQP